MRPEFSAVSNEYRQRWQRATVNPARMASSMRSAQVIVRNRSRYEAVSAETGVPWWVIGIIHCMEAGLSFSGHLHNGDPLTHRTVQVPKGMPRTPDPPYSWEYSATDAIKHEQLDKIKDWGIERLCYTLEGYNGWGYRGKGVPTAYLWAGTSEYTKGKFIKDGVWSASAISGQNGVMAILKELVQIDPKLLDAHAGPSNDNADPEEQSPITPLPPPPLTPRDLAANGSRHTSILLWLLKISGLGSLLSFAGIPISNFINADTVHQVKDTGNALYDLIHDANAVWALSVGGGLFCICCVIAAAVYRIAGGANAGRYITAVIAAELERATGVPPEASGDGASS